MTGPDWSPELKAAHDRWKTRAPETDDGPTREELRELAAEDAADADRKGE